MIKRFIIIVAGGTGKRMNSELPKQFIELNGKPILMHTIETFYSFDNTFSIIIVLPTDQMQYWQEILKKHEFKIPHAIVSGGPTRFDSVKNGLTIIKGEGLVAVHDGVRPLVNHATIARCFDTAEKTGNAVPCIPVHETVRQIVSDTSRVIDRSSIKLIQTPQVFDCTLIKKAYEQPFQPNFTDDASILENLGIHINLVEGNRENIKITEPFDVLIAKTLFN